MFYDDDDDENERVRFQVAREVPLRSTIDRRGGGGGVAVAQTVIVV